MLPSVTPPNPLWKSRSPGLRGRFQRGVRRNDEPASGYSGGGREARSRDSGVDPRKIVASEATDIRVCQGGVKLSKK